MRRAIPVLLLLVAVAGITVLLVRRLAGDAPPGALHGNVEIRKIDLSFNAQGTVTAMAKIEGDRVHTGEIIAELDPVIYQSSATLAAARRDAAKAQLDALLAGTRPEEIDQARANLASAQASMANAETTLVRQQDLVTRNMSSQQQLDDAGLVLDNTRANMALTQAVLTEAVSGPRIEDIDAAHANLRANEGELALARNQLALVHLIAPVDGTIMARVIEPGTVVLPAAAVYAMAIDGEVWVRAFAPESLLARVTAGTEVDLVTDCGHSYHGRIGYLSPQAEFTPKTAEAPGLPTQLAYRLRIRVTDPDDGIRQGMPMAIHLQSGG
jgi:HlyD family secretion protein